MITTYEFASMPSPPRGWRERKAMIGIVLLGVAAYAALAMFHPKSRAQQIVENTRLARSVLLAAYADAGEVGFKSDLSAVKDVTDESLAAHDPVLFGGVHRGIDSTRPTQVSWILDEADDKARVVFAALDFDRVCYLLRTDYVDAEYAKYGARDEPCTALHPAVRWSSTKEAGWG